MHLGKKESEPCLHGADTRTDTKSSERHFKAAELAFFCIIESVYRGHQKSLQNLGQHQDGCGAQARMSPCFVQKLSCAHTESCVLSCSLHLKEGHSGVGEGAEKDS